MNILSIGNSFSQDSQRYLSKIAANCGFDLKTCNLYIGGCSLATHYRNMLGEHKAYLLETNGESTGFYVSLKEALINRDWDVITLQQVSGEAPRYDTYQPYLSKLAGYVKNCVPKAKIAIHQTWAYEKDSYRLCTELGYKTPNDMFGDIKNAYKNAAEDVCADLIIPSGELFQKLTALGVKMHRDTFHASLGAGRFALGLLWFAFVSGQSVRDCSFCDFDEPVSEKDIETIKRCVNDLSIATF